MARAEWTKASEELLYTLSVSARCIMSDTCHMIYTHTHTHTHTHTLQMILDCCDDGKQASY